MSKYKYNPDSAKVHRISNRTGKCNFPLMDKDEDDFLADTDAAALKVAKERFSKSATKCEHCME
jgi:hypothetical protein